MMTDEDIVRAVRAIRYASKRLRNGRKATSVRTLAAAAGLDRMTIYRVAASGRMSPETANNLRVAMSGDRRWPDMSQTRVD